jgi:hypothetical protein
MLNTYIYHQLPGTYFGVCYTIFRETIALRAQKLYAFCNVSVKCTIYPIILIRIAVTTFKRKMKIKKGYIALFIQTLQKACTVGASNATVSEDGATNSETYWK